MTNEEPVTRTLTVLKPTVKTLLTPLYRINEISTNL